MLTTSLQKMLKNGCSWYDAKLYLMVRLQFRSSWECAVPHSLSLLPGPLWFRVEVLVRVSSFAQKDLFENHLYQIEIFENITPCKLFVLDRNTWNNMTLFIESDPKDPFSIATAPKCRGGCYSIPELFHFTIDPHLIVLSAKQGGIKYHF